MTPVYDVFLSFRESDTGRTFVSHLRRSLIEKGIQTFNYETAMISNSFGSHEAAIRASKIAVVVISENYASSRWCLEELTEILNLRRKSFLKVFPIFYGVHSTDVYNQTGKFGEQFKKHTRENPDQIQRWRILLTILADIHGHHSLSRGREDEAEGIQKITNYIWKLLSAFRYDSLVGMDLHMENMFKLLALESDIDGLREIGISGSVGIGKTTLVKYMYQLIYSYFDVHVLLRDVTKIHQELQSKHIQASACLYMIFRDGIASFTDQRVLLVADGVDTIEHIHILRKDIKLFGPGSRVIFTSQDKQLFLDCDVKHLYQVEPMAFSEALRLFSICAFKQIHPPRGRIGFSHRAVKLADGIPLVIAAVGTELFARSEEEWGIVLSRYEQLSGTTWTEKNNSRVSSASKTYGRSKEQWKIMLPKYKQSSDEGTLGTEESNSGISTVSCICGRSKEEWKIVLSEFEQSSDEVIIRTEESSFGVSDHKDMSLMGKNTTFSCVGMSCHIQAVRDGLMDLESENEIRIIGICGVRGVGKTTLARCVYEESMQQFHTHIFLENVGKIYHDHGSSHLLEELLLENIRRGSNCGSDVTLSRLRNRKVLLIVDGVDNNEQIEDVKEVATWCGAGSRVIVTTQDENLLVDNGVKHVYEVKCLKVHEALQVFYQFAFKQQTPSSRFKQLSVRVVQLAGHIPLALEVLGSFLCGKSENDWESVLQKLERQQDKDLVEVAETSSDVGVSCEEEKDDEESDDDDYDNDIFSSSWKTMWLILLQRLKQLLWNLPISIIVAVCTYAIECVPGIDRFTGSTHSKRVLIFQKEVSNLESKNKAFSDLLLRGPKTENSPQKSLNHKQQELLLKSISKDIGFSKGKPVAACLIYKCLIHWRSFEVERTSIFDRIIETIASAIEMKENSNVLCYWLSNSATLLMLLQRTLKANVTGNITTSRRVSEMSLRGSPQSSGFPFMNAPALLFKQQLTAFLEKIYEMIRDEMKEDISLLLDSCIQAPRTPRSGLVKGHSHWKSIVTCLNGHLSTMRANYVPTLLISKVFEQLFSFINVQLFNSILLRRECCSFSNGEYVKTGLSELEQWCHDATEEFSSSAWDELKHVRQAVGFLVIHQKPKKSLKEITTELCPVLTIQQLYRISTLCWDDKYGTHNVSLEVISSMRLKMSEESNNAISSSFLLDDDSSIPFSLDDISKTMQDLEVAEVDLPPMILQNSNFMFLLEMSD